MQREIITVAGSTLAEFQSFLMRRMDEGYGLITMVPAMPDEVPYIALMGKDLE